MPARQAPCVELGSAPDLQSLPASSPSASDISGASSPEPPPRATALFRALAMPPPPPPQPQGQEELERRLPGFRRVVLPREPTLLELLKQSSGVRTDEEVLGIREARLRVVAERAGLRRLHVLAPRLRALTLDGSVLGSLRDLGTGLTHLKVCRCGLASLDGVLGLGRLRELYASGNRVRDLEPLAALRRLRILDLSDNPISASSRVWTLGVCAALRRLRLRGTPASAAPDYSRRVAAALPALQYLDDAPLHESVLEEVDDLLGPAASSSSDEEDADAPAPAPAVRPPAAPAARADALAEEWQVGDELGSQPAEGPQRLERPASARCAGGGPSPPPLRPHSARPAPAASAAALASAAVRRQLASLEVLNGLIEAEFRSSGSRLTSGPPVCGNLAQALRARRPASAASAASAAPAAIASTSREHLSDNACAWAPPSSLAAEIPPAPCAGDDDVWMRFRLATGIDLNLNFDERTREEDSSSVLSRLEEIERDTSDRLRRESLQKVDEESAQNDGSARKESEAAPDDGITRAVDYFTGHWQAEC